jgi:hypothetical protein
MNWKDSISIFKQKLKREQTNRKDPLYDMTDEEAMYEMSVVQKNLGDWYKPLEKSGTINLVAGTSSYTILTSITDFGEVKTVRFGATSAPTVLEPVSMDYIEATNLESGVPAKFCISGGKIYLDVLPDNSYTANTDYRLTIFYFPKYDLFDSNKGASGTFQAWNKALTGDGNDYTSDGFGGEWLLPQQWHNLIIEGAIANIYPDKIPMFKVNVEMLEMRRNQSVSGKLPYSLGGITNDTNV